MLAECYVLDVQCDCLVRHKNERLKREQFTGPNRNYCRRAARDAGWQLYKDGRTRCPKCNDRSNAVLSGERSESAAKHS